MSPVFRRYKGQRIKHGSKDYHKGTWYAEGTVDGQYYKESLKHRAKTREDAQREEDKIISRIRGGEYEFHKDKTTFEDYVREYYEPRIRRENATWENNKKFQLERLTAFFGHYKLKAITPQLCEQYLEHRQRQKVNCQDCRHGRHGKAECSAPFIAPSTVNRDLVTLRHLFNQARDVDRKIKYSPMDGIKNLTEPPSRNRILTTNEKKRLFEVLNEMPVLRSIVLLGLLTGWRRGQILSIKKEDLDYTRQAVFRGKSKKNPSGWMPVNSAAWTLLTRLAEQVESGHLLRYPYTGEPVKCFKQSWWKALEKAGIENFRFHDIRRCFATELFSQGAREFEVQRALGHSKLETTNIYVNVYDEVLRAALEQQGVNYSDLVM